MRPLFVAHIICDIKYYIHFQRTAHLLLLNQRAKWNPERVWSVYVECMYSGIVRRTRLCDLLFIRLTNSRVFAGKHLLRLRQTLAAGVGYYMVHSYKYLAVIPTFQLD